MVEKHQSALLQTFNKKKHAYLSKFKYIEILLYEEMDFITHPIL